ncbi:hypothetical protein [Dactylosporangium sp. NPDC048998]|uniref:hypothetical protein n=1 Tax=Dactylosporangium sp. NPDC048998 TaxID=3363976 RepID=UPI003719A18C
MSTAAAAESAAGERSPAPQRLRVIRRADEVAAVLRDVNATAVARDRTGVLPRAVERAERVDRTGATAILPVAAELRALFPLGGLRRGDTVAAVGSTSLVLVLLAEAMAAGCTAVTVDLPELSPVTAAEYGIPLERLEVHRFRESCLVLDVNSSWSGGSVSFPVPVRRVLVTAGGAP